MRNRRLSVPPTLVSQINGQPLKLSGTCRSYATRKVMSHKDLTRDPTINVSFTIHLYVRQGAAGRYVDMHAACTEARKMFSLAWPDPNACRVSLRETLTHSTGFTIPLQIISAESKPLGASSREHSLKKCCLAYYPCDHWSHTLTNDHIGTYTCAWRRRSCYVSAELHKLHYIFLACSAYISAYYLDRRFAISSNFQM